MKKSLHVANSISNNSNEISVATHVLPASLPQSGLIASRIIDVNNRNVANTLPTDNITKKKNRKCVSKTFGNFVQKVVKTVSDISLHSSNHEHDDTLGSCHTTATTTCPSNSYRNSTKKDQSRLSPCKWPIHSVAWKKRYLDSSNKRVSGTVGIRNHGNTCFMNAVLQCLSHTELFIEYFLTDEYKTGLRMRKNQINKKFG